MPLNLIKVYPALLELDHLQDGQRRASLIGVFKRDIEDNPGFGFRGKKIWPIKTEVEAMQVLFTHLTCGTEDVEENGQKFKRRIFDYHRSKRLHWVRHHVEEKKKVDVEVFSAEERVNGRNVFRTYIYDTIEEYIIVLEPQRTGTDYYLLTAHHLTEDWAKKAMAKRMKRKLLDIL